MNKKKRLGGKRRITGKTRPSSAAVAPRGARASVNRFTDTFAGNQRVDRINPTALSPQPDIARGTSAGRTQQASKNSTNVTASLSTLVSFLAPSVTQFADDMGNTILGTVVSSDGLIVTKASCLSETSRCIFSDGKRFDYRVIATDSMLDLSLVEVTGRATVPVVFPSTPRATPNNGSPAPGTFVVSAGARGERAAWGIVTVSHHHVAAATDLFRQPNAAAAEALFQDQWGGGPFSQQRFGFGDTLVHDSVLHPTDCGGPLVDLEGNFVGVNIARSIRVATMTIESQAIMAFITKHRPEAVLTTRN